VHLIRHTGDGRHPRPYRGWFEPAGVDQRSLPAVSGRDGTWLGGRRSALKSCGTARCWAVAARIPGHLQVRESCGARPRDRAAAGAVSLPVTAGVSTSRTSRAAWLGARPPGLPTRCGSV